MNQIQNGGRHGGTILVWWLESSLHWHIMFGGFGSYVFFSFQSRFKLFLKVFILLFRFMLNLLGALLKWIVPTTLGNLQLVSLLLELFSTFRHSISFVTHGENILRLRRTYKKIWLSYCFNCVGVLWRALELCVWPSVYLLKNNVNRLFEDCLKLIFALVFTVILLFEGLMKMLAQYLIMKPLRWTPSRL